MSIEEHIETAKKEIEKADKGIFKASSTQAYTKAIAHLLLALVEQKDS